MKRSCKQKIIDFVTFPLRSLTIFEKNKWGLTSLRSERFEYVSQEVKGFCLDIGCGRDNLFITKYLDGNGIGIDIFPYEGLKQDNLVENFIHLPFPDKNFDCITLIANIGHIPKSLIAIELKEISRVLKSDGIIIVTTGNPIAEYLIHKVVYYYDKIFKTDYDIDTIRGMHEEENILITKNEVLFHLKQAGFGNFQEKKFLTQWGLNRLIVGNIIR